MLKINTFQEFAVELSQSQDGASKVVLREERRVEIETTDSIFGNMFGDDSLNPESILIAQESAE